MTDLSADQVQWGSEVVDEVVLGSPCRAFAPRPHHLGELLVASRRFPDRAYVVQGDKRLTFAEHERAVAGVRGLLVSAELQPGDRVLLLGANTVEWVIAFWALVDAGCVVVLGNAWWGAAEVTHALEVARPQVVVADRKRAELLPPEARRLGYEDVAAAAAAAARSGAGAGRGGAVPDEDDPAVVLFTSGTTGLPKGAVLSHRGLLAVLQSLLVVTRRLPDAAEPPPPSRALLSLPLFHIGGLQQIITPMATGGTLVFAQGRFDPKAVVDLLRAEQVSVWSAVPTMVARALDYLEASGAPPLDCVRTVGMGGAPVPQQLRARVPGGFPNASRGLAVTYGLSEACGVVATGAGDVVNARPGCVGRPLPVCDVRIDEPDETGQGEIVIRSPSVMLGYLGAGAADEDPVGPDRWLHSGDIGWIDDDGYLYVTDRSKDIVIRGGENIATPNVENRLLGHPEVSEVAVLGLPHATLGEELGAVVVVRPGTVTTAADLAAFVGAELAYFEVPSRWWIRQEPLPRNPTGKVLKRAVRDAWLQSNKSGQSNSGRESEWENSPAG